MSTFHAAIGAALTADGLGDGDRVLLVWLLHAIDDSDLHRALQMPAGEPLLSACEAVGMGLDDVVHRHTLAARIGADGVAAGWAVTAAPVGRAELAEAMGTTVRTVGTRLASLRAAGLLATVETRHPRWAINIAALLKGKSPPSGREQGSTAPPVGDEGKILPPSGMEGNRQPSAALLSAAHEGSNLPQSRGEGKTSTSRELPLAADEGRNLPSSGSQSIELPPNFAPRVCDAPAFQDSPSGSPLLVLEQEREREVVDQPRAQTPAGTASQAPEASPAILTPPAERWPLSVLTEQTDSGPGLPASTGGPPPIVLAMKAWEEALGVTTLIAEVADRVAENLARHGLEVVVGGARSTRDYLAALKPKEAYRRSWARRSPRLVDERCEGEAEVQKARGAGSGRDRFGDYTGAAAKARANRNSPICEDDDVWAAAAAITNRDMEGQ